MKRRNFLTAGAGLVGTGFTSCISDGHKPIALWKELAPFVPRPKGGSMPYSELGKTGIRISNYGFGSHIRAEMRGYDYQREYLIHEAVDLGINVFDVYDEEEGVSKGGSFQYEPFGKQIKPYVNDVLISISFRPSSGRTPEQEFERALRLFNRSHIDLVRLLRKPENELYEFLFKKKEQGYIRAVGAPIHDMEHVDMLVGKVPLDYILFPYNFYHNICWLGEKADNFDNLPNRLRQHDIGVMTMKPFAGDYLVRPFIDIARNHLKETEIFFPQAALRYIINSGIDASCTLTGMYNLPHLYENVEAYFNPVMSAEETSLLENIRKKVVRQTQAWLPDHYKWLDAWSPYNRAGTDV